MNTIMSKVLILQGSPRANGNTAWMAEEYKKAAEAAGHEVPRFRHPFSVSTV